MTIIHIVNEIQQDSNELSLRDLRPDGLVILNISALNGKTPANARPFVITSQLCQMPGRSMAYRYQHLNSNRWVNHLFYVETV